MPIPKWEFRIANDPDTEAVVSLVESAYRGESSQRGWTTEANLLDGQRTDREEISELIADSQTRLILASEPGKLLGCVVVRQQGEAAYIGMLAVLPDQQGSGLGRELLRQAEHCARCTFGASRCRMTVIVQREELIRWYERRGYLRTNRREPFPYGNPRFGLPRRDDLEFVVLVKALDDSQPTSPIDGSNRPSA